MNDDKTRHITLGVIIGGLTGCLGVAIGYKLGKKHTNELYYDAGMVEGIFYSTNKISEALLTYEPMKKHFDDFCDHFDKFIGVKEA